MTTDRSASRRFQSAGTLKRCHIFNWMGRGSSVHRRITPQKAIATLFNPWDTSLTPWALTNRYNFVVQAGREI